MKNKRTRRKVAIFTMRMVEQGYDLVTARKLAEANAKCKGVRTDLAPRQVTWLGR